MYYRRKEHCYKDSDLIKGTELKNILGVSNVAVTKAKKNGRVDTFENSKGKECFHRIFSVKQYTETKDRRHITGPTRAQIASGFDNLTAQAVAHRKEFDAGLVPKAVAGANNIDPFNIGDVLAERADLETSKAQKEFYQARLMKLKADEMEGRLVPKQQAAIAVYQLGANIQDKIMTIYSSLAPEIVGYFKELMNENEIDKSKILRITENSVHHVGESIRQACLNALRDLTNKTQDDILDV